MYSKTQNGVTVASASGFFDFVDEAANSTSKLSEANRLSRITDDALWSGAKTFNDAVKIAENGWPDGLSKINRKTQMSFNKLSEIVLKPVVLYSDEPPGIGFDIPRVINGEPEYWVHIKEPQTRGVSLGPVRIVVNGTVSSNVSPEIIECKGAAVAALVSLLEYSGRPVELVVAYGVCQYPAMSENEQGERLEVYVTIKKPDAHLNPMILAIALANPIMSRRFLTSYMESFEELRKSFRIPGHFGYPTEVSHVGDLYVFSGVGFPGIVDNWSDDKQVEAWIMWTLKQQGVEIDEELLDDKTINE